MIAQYFIFRITIRLFLLLFSSVQVICLQAQLDTWSPLNFPYDTTYITSNIDELHYSNNLEKLIVNGNVTLFDEDFEPYTTLFYPYYDGEEWGSMQQCFYTFLLYFNEITDYHQGFVTTGSICSGDSILQGPFYFDGLNEPQFLGEFDGSIQMLKVIQDTLYAAGIFNTINGVEIPAIAKYDGNNWLPVFNTLPDFPEGSGIFLNTLDYYQGNWYLGGNFSAEQGNDFLRYANGEWESVVGEDGAVVTGNSTGFRCSAIYNGELIVAGGLMQSQGNIGHGLQSWDGINWHEVGNSVQSFGQSTSLYSQIDKMIVYESYLYIAGAFVYAGNASAKCLARWDGSQWCGMQTEALEFPLYYFAVMDGRVVLRTSFNQQVPFGFYIHDGSSFFPCSSPVGITEKKGNRLSIYPNPSQGTTSIQLPAGYSDISIALFNNVGQVLLEKTSSAEGFVQLDTTSLPPGIYFVKVVSGNTLLGVEKLVVQLD